MYSDLLITVLLITVLVLLILGIIIAATILKLLQSLKRAAKVLDKTVDDIEKFSKVVSQIRFPFAWGGFIKKLASFLPDRHNPDKREE